MALISENPPERGRGQSKEQKFIQIFLQEKGYLKKAQPIIKLLDKIEPRFIEILRQRY